MQGITQITGKDTCRNIQDGNTNHEAISHVTSQNERELVEPHRLQVKLIQDTESSRYSLPPCHPSSVTTQEALP